MASTSATRIGMYSGRQPAITPFTATSTRWRRRRSGSSTPELGLGGPVAKRRNARTRSGVGGTIGRPSLQSFS